MRERLPKTETQGTTGDRVARFSTTPCVRSLAVTYPRRRLFVGAQEAGRPAVSFSFESFRADFQASAQPVFGTEDAMRSWYRKITFLDTSFPEHLDASQRRIGDKNTYSAGTRKYQSRPRKGKQSADPCRALYEALHGRLCGIIILASQSGDW
jgi:hypothetical protein